MLLMPFRFTIRDLRWLTLVVALAIGCGSTIAIGPQFEMGMNRTLQQSIYDGPHY